MECRKELLERLAELAKIALSEEEKESICKDLERIAGYLRAVGEAAKELEAEPLYYVWDLPGPLREPSESPKVSIEELPTKVKEGYVAVPWRGGRVE